VKKSQMKSVALILIVISLSGCGIYETKDDGTLNLTSGPGNERVTSTSLVSYAQVSAQVFAVSCKSCHMNGASRGGVTLNSYASTVSNLAAIRSTVFDGSPSLMPPQGLPDAQKAILQQWIDQGAVEVPAASSATRSTPIPVSTPSLVATYQSIREGILIPKCLMCHIAGGAARGIPLDTYANLTKSRVVVPGNLAKSDLYSDVVSGSMPTRRSGLARLTVDELNVVKMWILNGAAQ
jgi:hypothetical protein